jgi:hypothetical protein
MKSPVFSRKSIVFARSRLYSLCQSVSIATDSSAATRITFPAISQHVGMHFSDAQPAMAATIASSSIRLNIRFIITSPSVVFVIASLRQRAAVPTRQHKTSFATAQDADAVCTDRHTDHRSAPPAGRLVQ